MKKLLSKKITEVIFNAIVLVSTLFILIAKFNNVIFYTGYVMSCIISLVYIIYFVNLIFGKRDKDFKYAVKTISTVFDIENKEAVHILKNAMKRGKTSNEALEALEKQIDEFKKLGIDKEKALNNLLLDYEK